jgi:chromosome segregation ATPase
MASRTKLTDAETLELYRVALDNAENQTEIATIMAELGYDSAVIGEGKALLTETRSAYDLNKTEDDETSAAYADFAGKKEQLQDTFTLHRKKAKVVFRNDSLTADKLAISGAMPRTYIKWLEAAKKFYGLASTDTDIQSKLARLKITADDLTAANTAIADLEAARAEYLKEKGESQDATKAKDAAFAKMDDWMSEFYAVARIGLEDNPQLLEALGKTVKS